MKFLTLLIMPRLSRAINDIQLKELFLDTLEKSEDEFYAKFPLEIYDELRVEETRLE
ncbi:MAG: hypothetical protein AB8V19_02720 [Candidatus Midichloria sp.]|uniref:Uncharacterized protein n=1 Tax=Hyalomma marginatum TaxID=34627 RepID=A0A8S4C2N2_9ACAR|nr:hypothetical protein MHYMCMPASI_00658 [Hyalomma marginatum]CAG7593101.1 hypothetical protein MHYMCMPSP_00777 [Hyalomma marginatum]